MIDCVDFMGLAIGHRWYSVQDWFPHQDDQIEASSSVFNDLPQPNYEDIHCMVGSCCPQIEGFDHDEEICSMAEHKNEINLLNKLRRKWGLSYDDSKDIAKRPWMYRTYLQHVSSVFGHVSGWAAEFHQDVVNYIKFRCSNHPDVIRRVLDKMYTGKCE